MKSTSGVHYVALDQLRALAAFLVICWHFIPVDLHIHNVAPKFPFVSLFHEGNTGVSLFMVLSGYLFAKLLDNKKIVFRAFLRNRALRLFPLLSVVIVWWMITNVGVHHWRVGRAIEWALKGFVLPIWPNGGWSIAVELQFYILLPVLLAMSRNSVWPLIATLAVAIAVRAGVHVERGNLQDFAYWTLGGRIDQFVIGIVVWRLRAYMRPWLCAALFVGFVLFWWSIDIAGGQYGSRDSVVWTIQTTVEAIGWSALVVWYDARTPVKPGVFGRAMAEFGAVSYSVYLLHFYWIFIYSDWLRDQGFPVGNTGAAIVASLAFCVMIFPVSWLCFRYIESPFLKKRVSYTVPLSRE